MRCQDGKCTLRSAWWVFYARWDVLLGQRITGTRAESPWPVTLCQSHFDQRWHDPSFEVLEAERMT